MPRRPQALRLASESYDVVITDLRMPGMSGLEFFRALQHRPHGAQILMVTAHATVASAVDAMKHGAFDYIEKPFDADQLEQLVARALEHGRLLDQRSPVRSAGQQPTVIIGSSGVMQSLRARLAQVAPTRETVLITGESGTGKELVARWLHGASDRRDSPLVSLNCPALSAHLMESELFGHERGFTGAENARTGRFELADKGTILLTKSRKSNFRCRPSCCGFCRSDRSSASAPAKRSWSTCVCWPRPTAICPPRSRPALPRRSVLSPERGPLGRAAATQSA